MALLALLTDEAVVVVALGRAPSHSMAAASADFADDELVEIMRHTEAFLTPTTRPRSDCGTSSAMSWRRPGR
jgi:hypothetical protein